MLSYPHKTLLPQRQNKHTNNASEFAWLTTLATVTATAMISTSFVWLCAVARKYGWIGLLLYLSEGTPHPPRIVRSHKEFLQSVAAELRKVEQGLDALENDLKFANSPFLNGTVARFLRQTYEHTVVGGDLRRRLSLLINELDQLAAQIDQVLSAPEIIGMKNEMAHRVAQTMERAAHLLLQPCMKSSS